MRKKGKKYMSDAQRYQNLNQQINIIKSKLADLTDIHNELNFEIKETILIDDKMIEEEKLKSILDDNKAIIDELNNRVIPVVENNMY